MNIKWNEKIIFTVVFHWHAFLISHGWFFFNKDGDHYNYIQVDFNFLLQLYYLYQNKVFTFANEQKNDELVIWCVFLRLFFKNIYI